MEKRLARLNSYRWSSYGGFVEAGIAQSDEEFMKVIGEITAELENERKK